MELKLERLKFTGKSTIGKLYINGKYLCDTLEDCDRYIENGNNKIKYNSAIPRGTYEIVMNYSDRFKSVMPLLLNVPQFEGIRIHSGNTAKDTSGCILVGIEHHDNYITASRLNYNILKKLILLENKQKKIFIEIK